MDKQTNRLIIRVDDDLKNKFKTKCDINHMTISSRIKYLIQLDIDGKLNIKNG